MNHKGILVGAGLLAGIVFGPFIVGIFLTIVFTGPGLIQLGFQTGGMYGFVLAGLGVVIVLVIIRILQSIRNARADRRDWEELNNSFYN